MFTLLEQIIIFIYVFASAASYLLSDLGRRTESLQSQFIPILPVAGNPPQHQSE